VLALKDVASGLNAAVDNSSTEKINVSSDIITKQTGSILFASHLDNISRRVQPSLGSLEPLLLPLF
jgi:hypothetical protein